MYIFELEYIVAYFVHYNIIVIGYIIPIIIYYILYIIYYIIYNICIYIYTNIKYQGKSVLYCIT